MATTACIALVDGDSHARDAFAAQLRDNHFYVDAVASMSDLDTLDGDSRPDCVIVALSPAGHSGFEDIRAFRSRDDRPMIALSAANQSVDRIIALELGADDVIERDITPREVSARVRAIMRRIRSTDSANGTPQTLTVMRFGRWSLDVVRRRVFNEAEGEVDMTSGEFDILRCFVQNPLRPLTRQQILDETRGGRCEGYERSIDVLIGRIRRKIEEDQSNPRLIQTVRGIGYVFAAAVNCQ